AQSLARASSDASSDGPECKKAAQDPRLAIPREFARVRGSTEAQGASSEDPIAARDCIETASHDVVFDERAPQRVAGHPRISEQVIIECKRIHVFVNQALQGSAFRFLDALIPIVHSPREERPIDEKGSFRRPQQTPVELFVWIEQPPAAIA